MTKRRFGYVDDFRPFYIKKFSDEELIKWLVHTYSWYDEAYWDRKAFFTSTEVRAVIRELKRRGYTPDDLAEHLGVD
jgi:hypothetical protein